MLHGARLLYGIVDCTCKCIELYSDSCEMLTVHIRFIKDRLRMPHYEAYRLSIIKSEQLPNKAGILFLSVM